MIIDVTYQCKMGCYHCCMECTPNSSEHMDDVTFQNTISFIKSLKLGLPLVLLVSGGEPTLHPNIFSMLKDLQKISPMVSLLTNGMWLDDEQMCKTIKDLDIPVQITNDERFYPQPINFDNAKKYGFFVETQIRMLSVTGRAIKLPERDDIQYRKSPSCFNSRSISKNNTTNLGQLIDLLSASQKFCSPLIMPTGDIVFGENRCCTPVGNVNTHKQEEIFYNLKKLKCDNCGLGASLVGPYKEIFYR